MKEEPGPTQHPVDGQPGMVDVEISSVDEGELKEFRVGAKSYTVVVSKLAGKLYAVGGTCTESGASLSKGLIFEDKIVSPDHASAYNLVTGAAEWAPAKDGLPTYEVIEKDSKIFVRVPKQFESRKLAPSAKRDPANTRKMVILGSGIPAMSAAETLRDSQFTGEIVVLSKHDPIRSSFHDFSEIDLKSGEAVLIDKNSKSVVLKDGERVSYDKLLVTSDHRQMKVTGKRVAVVGTDALSSKLVQELRAQGKTVYYIVGSEIPMKDTLGYDVASMLLQQHEKNGVKVYASHP